MSAPAMAWQEPARGAPAARASGWLLLTLDGLRLALPQKDVRQIELVADLEPATGTAALAGWLRREDGESWPAFCLDGELALVQPVPATRRVCVFFATGHGVTGLLCDRLASLASDGELRPEPLPGCMHGFASPLGGVARLGDGLVLISGARDLERYLSGLQETGS